MPVIVNPHKVCPTVINNNVEIVTHGGMPGPPGIPGSTPYIDSATGNWFIDGKDTGYKASVNTLMKYDSFDALPSCGDENTIYLVTDDYSMYIWESDIIQYVCVNKFELKIDKIECGNSYE